jgi:hypothetical protein
MHASSRSAQLDVTAKIFSLAEQGSETGEHGNYHRYANFI